MTWLTLAADIALVALTAGAALCLWRIIRGPHPVDRVAAFDCLVLDVVGAVIVLSLRLGTDAFVDVVLVVALLGFIGTMALAAWLEGTLDE